VVTAAELITNRAARAGDVLVLTKPLGTGFVTTAFKAGRCPEDVIAVASESMAMLNAAACQAALSVGAKAATDITGFGLAGHARELADASNVTIEIELVRLPLLPGAAELAASGNKTRASATNRSFVESSLRWQGSHDAVLAEFLFDAQTSGGLLICAAADRASELVERARAGGASATTIVGRVLPRADHALVVT
jgi:selenide,water dikinase